jgi:hypothetical protein
MLQYLQLEVPAPRRNLELPVLLELVFLLLVVELPVLLELVFLLLVV